MKAAFLLFLIIIICQFELFISKLERKWFYLVSRRNHELVLDSRTREGCVGDQIIYRKRNNNSLTQLWRYTHRNGNLINRRHRYALQLTRTNNSQGLVLNCHQPCNPFQKFGMHLIRRVVQIFTLQRGNDYILAENRECQTAQLTTKKDRTTPTRSQSSGKAALWARYGGPNFQLQLLYVPSPCFDEKHQRILRPEKCIPVASIYNISWTTTQITTEITSQTTTPTTKHTTTPTTKHTTTPTTTHTTSQTTTQTTKHTTSPTTLTTTKHTTETGTGTS